jgi:hypothetical protein
MKVDYLKSGALFLALIILVAPGAMGASYVEDTMDADPTDGTWTLVEEPGGGLATGTEVSVGDGLGTSTSGAGFTDFDRYRNSTTFTGNWRTGDGNVGIPVVLGTFEFWAGGGAQVYPTYLSFFIEDSSNNLWEYSFNSQLTGLTGDAWNPLSFNVNGSGWVGSGSTFDAVLGDVAQYGWIIGYHGVGGVGNTETYGFNNLRLHYPEPGTYAVLGFALLSLGVTFRGKLRTSLKELLKK